MKIISILLSFIFIVAGQHTLAFSEKQNDTAFNNIFIYRSPEIWKNEFFIFHEKPVSLQKFDYINIERSSDNNVIKRSIHPSYAECAGKKVKILKVVPVNNEYNVTMLSESGKSYTAKTVNGSIDGLIPLKDIENAKKYFTDKNVWLLRNNLLSYNEKKHQYFPVYAEKYSILKVLDVKPGWNTNTPVRFILETPHQEKGYIDINISGTNVPETVRNKNRFNIFLSPENPSNWDAQIKTLIKNNMIKPGMTCEQVRMSWGPSAEILKEENTSKEKWLYPYGDLLVFENGLLVDITEI